MAKKAIDSRFGTKGDVYLITRGQGKTTQQSANGVVIWAHGLQNGHTFTLQDSRLQFLCPDGFALRSTFYKHIANQQILNLPKLSRTLMGFDLGDNCPDYNLTKCISYHIDGRH